MPDSSDTNDRFPTPGPGADDVVETAFSILRVTERRTVVEYVRQRSTDSTTVDELVDHLLERRVASDRPPTTRRQLYVSLRHVHLPALADAGVVTYDPHGADVRYDGSTDLTALLEALEREQ